MIVIFIRSTVFNIAFFGLTGVLALCLLPTLAMRRERAMGIVHLWVNLTYVLEKIILGLDYEIRGAEHLPASAAYLVAAKHQSAYETMKLHRLFGDPAIVLKRELLSIPVWGLFLKKIDPIAIDRGNREQALKSLLAGVAHVREQGRPIVIFPQGTRVKWDATTDEKPYKGGVVKMQQASHLPIVPMALNTGLFWPKLSWIKRPGRVIFQFLPPIPPGGDTASVMKKLEHDIENASHALMAETLNKRKTNHKGY